MDEYIKREAAIKAANEGADNWDGGPNKGRYKHISDALNAVPAADVESVVRCKDCTFWDEKQSPFEGLARCCTGEGGIILRKSKDFCSRGKRRESDGE